MSYIQLHAIMHDIDAIILPRPGCGNGKLKWCDVKKVIEPILIDKRIWIINKE